MENCTQNILRFSRRQWQDILVGTMLGVAFSFSTYQRAELIPPIVFEGKFLDIWFESDCPRVYRMMTDREGDHSRAKVHPLFALIAFPPVYFLKKIFSINPITAVRLVESGAAFLWMLAFFTLLRLMGCRRPDTALLSLLAAVSAAGMFFFVIPETYPLGSLSLLVAFLILAVSQQRVLKPLWYVLMNAGTLSITTSNWMAGILVTMANHPWRRVLKIMGGTLLLAAALWAVEKLIFPSTGFFLNLAKEKNFLFRPEMGGPLHVLRSFFYHTLVMPAIAFNTDVTVPDWKGMITQPSAPGSASPWGVAAVLLWTLLLSLGVWAMFCSQTNVKFRVVLGLLLLGQLGFHLFYGFETFLYSLHFIVLLVPLVAFCFLTRFRIFAVGILLLLIPCVAVNNSLQFVRAVDFIEQYYGTHRD